MLMVNEVPLGRGYSGKLYRGCGSLNLHLSLNEQADWWRAMKGHPSQAGEQRGRSAENRWLTVEIFEPYDMEYI